MTCRDKGTDTEPIEIDCPTCEGGSCGNCQDGVVRIDGCPNDYCRPVINTVSMVELFGKGLPPVAGGVLDQSVWFLEASRILESEDAKAKSDT